jgi:DNA-binding transcriptional regulator LsrR (DeoR family)
MQQQQIEWCRAKVIEMLSKGKSNQSEIARVLQIDRSVICRDLSYLRQQSKNNIRKWSKRSTKRKEIHGWRRQIS